MEITFSKDGITKSYSNYDKLAELTELEKKADHIIMSGFKEANVDASQIIAKRHSESYLSYFNRFDIDFLRVKAGEKSTWISLDSYRMSDSLRDNEIFDDIKNKRIRHWKIAFEKTDDIKDAIDIIVKCYLSSLEYGNKSRKII